MGAMGDTNIGIRMLDPIAGFQKLNCRWVNSRSCDTTRPPYEKKAKKPPSSTVSISLKDDHIAWIKTLTRRESIRKKYNVTVSRFIRELIEKHLPYPRNLDMLGDKINDRK